MTDLAAVGSYGNSAQNCQRDLMKQFFRDVKAPSLTMVECPVCVRDLTTAERRILQKEVPVLPLRV